MVDRLLRDHDPLSGKRGQLIAGNALERGIDRILHPLSITVGLIHHVIDYFVDGAFWLS